MKLYLSAISAIVIVLSGSHAAEPLSLEEKQSSIDAQLEDALENFPSLLVKMKKVDSSFSANLNQSQNDWIIYRSAQASLVAGAMPRTKEQFKEAYFNEYTKLTAERLDFLMQFFTQIMGPLPCGNE